MFVGEGSPNVTAAALAAVLYGGSDFMAGLSARTSGTKRTALLVQASALLVLVLAIPFVPRAALQAGWGWVWSAVGGASSALASLVYFRGLARNSMGKVALIVGVLTIVLPAIVGIALGERITSVGAVGILGAIGSIVLVSKAGLHRRAFTREGLVESIVSGALFALAFVSLSNLASTFNLMTFVVYQGVDVVVTAVFARGSLRTVVSGGGKPVAMGVAAGVCATLGNLCFFAGSHSGTLAVASAIAALSPFVVIMLARLTLRERLDRLQKWGAALALCCVWLISLS